MLSVFSKVQQYLHSKQNSDPPTTLGDEPTSKKTTIDYYKMPLEDSQIVFVDSVSTYERLADRLFKTTDEEIFIGFDCKSDFPPDVRSWTVIHVHFR